MNPHRILPLREAEPQPQPAPNGFALFATGFRPFYLLASVFARHWPVLTRPRVDGLPG